MFTFIYSGPDGEPNKFSHHDREEAMVTAQKAFFADYKAGKWVGKDHSDSIQEEAISAIAAEEQGLKEPDGYSQFMEDVCNDDEDVDVDEMYEETNDAMDAVSEDMNPVAPMQPVFTLPDSTDDEQTEEDVANATTSRLEIAMSEDPQVREDTPVFQGGWGSGAKGVSNHSDKRTVDYNKVSQVAVERQEKHDAWLAEIGLARPTQNISITKAGYKRGTAVVDLGYDNLAAARAVWDEKPDVYTAVNQFVGLIESEHRENVDVPLHKLRMRDDGLIKVLGTYNEWSLEENALRQMLAAMRFGIGEDMVSDASLFPGAFRMMKSLDPDVRANVFNEHIRRHCSQDKVMRFRTRENGDHRSVFGVVGTGYQEYDADKVANMVLNAVGDMPYKADIQYNSKTTNLTMDLTMHAPEDLKDFSAGDLYEVGFRIKSNDGGGGAITGSSIAFWNECLNMIILHSEKNEIMRAIHKGDMQEKMKAIRKGIDDARPVMERFAEDWGILGQTSASELVTQREVDDLAVEGDTYSHVLLRKMVANGDIGEGLGRDALVQMLFDSYQNQGSTSGTVQDAINAVTRAAHEHLVNDCARDVLEREAGSLVHAYATALA